MAKIASDVTFFHPKVLIVTSQTHDGDFAVVGSGNLSKGGFQSNVECAVYVKDPDLVSLLIAWFDGQFESAIPLSPDVIAKYDQSYEKNRKQRENLEKKQMSVAQQLLKVGLAEIEQWNQAVNTATRYFQTSRHFGQSYDTRRKAAQQVRKALRFPDFKFTRAGFDEFFRIGPLGQLDHRWKNRIFSQVGRLRKGLRSLANDEESALANLLERGGKFHVPGVGLNFVSKVLVSLDPRAWSVFNSKVETALGHFGYKPPYRASEVARYLAYCDLMKKFASECESKGCKNVDAFALDAFFYDRARRLESKS